MGFLFLNRSGLGSNPGPRASEEDALSTPLRPTWLSGDVAYPCLPLARNLIPYGLHSAGAIRSVYVRDNKCSSNGTPVRPKADPTVEGQLGAPMKGDVVDVKISVGDRVEKGQVVAVLSAMKMEMAVQVGITKLKEEIT